MLIRGSLLGGGVRLRRLPRPPAPAARPRREPTVPHGPVRLLPRYLAARGVARSWGPGGGDRRWYLSAAPRTRRALGLRYLAGHRHGDDGRAGAAPGRGL